MRTARASQPVTRGRARGESAEGAAGRRTTERGPPTRGPHERVRVPMYVEPSTGTLDTTRVHYFKV